MDIINELKVFYGRKNNYINPLLPLETHSSKNHLKYLKQIGFVININNGIIYYAFSLICIFNNEYELNKNLDKTLNSLFNWKVNCYHQSDVRLIENLFFCTLVKKKLK